MTNNAVKNLRRARMRAGLNGRQIADLLGMHAGTYRQYESGRRHMKLELAVQVAKILECDLSELVGDYSEDLVAAPSGTDDHQSDAIHPQYLSVYGKSTILRTDEVEFVDTGTLVPRPDGVSGEAYALRVYSAKAGPRFEVGDLLICDPTEPVKANQWAVIGIKRGDRILAEIHRIKEIDTESRLVVLANDRQLSLDVCSSVDAIVSIRPRQ